MAEEWHHIDARGRVLGRLACEAANFLLGKHRVDRADHTVAPVFVVITNINQVVLTGKKEQQKKYRHYSGYPGGIKERAAADQRRRDACRLVAEAVFGMLPKNSLRAKRMQHLKLYAGEEHPHQAQLSNQ